MGRLPLDEEGSQVLLVARQRRELLRIPSSGPDSSRLERHLDLSLGVDGSLAGKLEELAYGHAAAALRRSSQQGASQERKRMESRLARAGSGEEITSLDSSDDGDHVRLVLEFRMARYAKGIGGSLLVLNANVLPASNSVHLPAGSRKYPVVVESEALEEDGFEVDERPRPIEGTASFGAHSSSCVVREGYLTCRHSVTVRNATVPVEHYEEDRSFFGARLEVEDELGRRRSRRRPAQVARVADLARAGVLPQVRPIDRRLQALAPRARRPEGHRLPADLDGSVRLDEQRPVPAPGLEAPRPHEDPALDDDRPDPDEAVGLRPGPDGDRQAVADGGDDVSPGPAASWRTSIVPPPATAVQGRVEREDEPQGRDLPTRVESGRSQERKR